MLARTVTLIAVVAVSASWLPEKAQAEALSYQTNLTRDAGRLYNSARIFNTTVRGRAGFSHLSRDTARLMNSAEYFMRAARATGNPRQLQYDFERVMVEMETTRFMVRQALRNRNDAAAERAWMRVEEDFDRIYFLLFEGYRHSQHSASAERLLAAANVPGPSLAYAISHVPFQFQLERPASLQRNLTLGMIPI